MKGDFHSLFKGSGLEFDDVRPYQYGDDVRAIDWNVSAKGHGTFIKTFKEDKEQTVFFVLDVSASGEIGKKGKTKGDIAKEICGVLSLSATKESSQVGLICFSDKKEKYIKPKKGTKQAYEIIRSIFYLHPQSRFTSINKAIGTTLKMIKRRGVVIFISDFIDDPNYYNNLKALAFRHDLIIIHIKDQREENLPRLGIIPVQDKESQRVRWVNSSFGDFRYLLKNAVLDRTETLEKFSKKHQINFVSIRTDEDYVPKLLKLFKSRNQTSKNNNK
jgi:uncharacterized protein (DUF58 family)